MRQWGGNSHFCGIQSVMVVISRGLPFCMRRESLRLAGESTFGLPLPSDSNFEPVARNLVLPLVSSPGLTWWSIILTGSARTSQARNIEQFLGFSAEGRARGRWCGVC